MQHDNKMVSLAMEMLAHLGESHDPYADSDTQAIRYKIWEGVETVVRAATQSVLRDRGYLELADHLNEWGVDEYWHDGVRNRDEMLTVVQAMLWTGAQRGDVLRYVVSQRHDMMDIIAAGDLRTNILPRVETLEGEALARRLAGVE